MRKLKLFLSLLTVMALSMGNVWGAGPDVTYDFTGSDWSVSGSELTNGTVSFTGAAGGSKGSFKMNSGYLMLGKKGAYLNFPTYSSAVKQIVVTGRSGASGSTKMNIYVGNTAVSTETTGSTGENSYDIATASQTAGTTYTLNVTSDHNAQITKIEIYYAEAAPSCTKTVSVTKVTPTNGDFSISATEVCGDGDGGEVTISDIEPATGYALDEVSVTVGTYDKNTGKVTGITNDTEISVTFKELQKYTVSFNTGAGNPAVSPITEATAGAGITLPAGPTPACSADGWTFAGWSAEAVASETTSAPKLLSGNYKPTDNVTLFAVYKRTEGGSGAGAEIGATLFNEEFNGLSASDQPTAPSEGATVYGSASVSYTCESTYAKIYAESSAGGASPEMLIPRSDRNGYFEISNIPTGAASALTLTYRTNQSGLSVTSSTDGISIGNATGSNPYSRTITINQEKKPASFDLKFAMTTSSNGRLDNISIIVETSSAAGTTYYLSAPSCCEKHNVNIALGIQYGKVEADLTEACEGTEVTLTATPNEHCRFVKWDVKQGETPVAVSENKFTMPEGNVTVSATFEEIRNTVNIINPGHGDITVTGADDLDAVLEGTELSVEVSGAGYEFTLKAYKVGEESTIVPITDGKLTMPAYGIVITADEQELVSPTILVSKDLIDFGKAVKGGAAPAFETFTISGANLTGDLSLAWESDDAYFTWEVTEGSLAANAGIVEATIRVNVTAKGMSVADTHMDNLIVSGGSATQKEVIVGVEVQQTYTAKWFVNGEELTESTQTAVAGTDLIAPSNPTKLADDCSEMIFKGWAEAPIDGKQADAPAFVNFEGAKMPAEDVNYYAVFAKEVIVKIPKVKDYTHTIEAKTWDAAGAQTLSAVEWTLANDGNYYGYDATKGQQVGSGSAPATSMSLTTSGISGTINKVKIYTSGAKDIAATVAVSVNGESYLCDSKESATLTTTNTGYEFAGDEEGEIVISWAQTSSKGMYFKQMDVNYTVMEDGEGFSDYMTTCPSCQKVTLTKAGETNGTFAIKQSGIEVASLKTCEAVELTLDVTPATGYALKTFEINGVTGATYNEGNGTISIPANATGELTVTAYFSQLNYTVTMKQTGGADATISADQIDKHYGDEITVSAEDKDGFVFLNWEATPAVEFANAKALETTFAMPANDVTVTANFAKILTVAEAVALIDAEGTIENQVIEGYVSKLYSSSVSAGGQISYYIQDIDENGFLTGIEFEAYNGKGMNGAAFAEITDVKVGAKVRLYGKLKKFKETYEFDANNYQLIYTEAANPSVVVYGEADYKAYYYNEDFLFDGLSAKKAYDNGYAEAIAAPQWKASPAKITESGNVAVTATYETLTSAPFNVAVTKKLRELTDEQLAWSADAATAYTVGKAYTLPTLTNTLGLAVTYTSETPETATISNEEGHEGEISIVAAGSTVITASFAGNDEYAAKEVSYTLTVVAPASVVITGEASNTAYEYGYNFSFEGLAAKAVYTNEDEYEIPAAEITWAATPATVTMDNNVSVKATWEGIESAAELVAVTVKKHKVTIVQPDHGTLVVKYSKDDTPVASGAELVLGTQLIFEIIPESSDYKAGKVLVNNRPIEEMEGTIGKIDYEFSAQIFEKAEAGIEWSRSDGEIQVQGTEIVNSDLLPSLTNPNKLTIEYSSDNTDVAVIDPETGVITPKAEGNTTISATFAGNEDYKAAQVSFNLTVDVVAQPEFYLVGPFNSWDEFVPVYDTWYEFENLTPGDYKLKVTTAPNWADLSKVYGYDALTVKHAGLSKDNDGNICFTISNESSIVIVDFEKDEEGVKTFTVIGGYVKPTFTVVGVEALVGYNWGDGLNAYENEMAEDLPTENYILEKENVMLAAGDYEYQVAMNHDWRGVSNSTLAIAESGIYTVTFTYVPSTGKTSATADLVELIDILPTMKIAGDWDVDLEDPKKWNENELEGASDNLTATYKAKDLVKGTWYHFWIIKNGVYMSGNNEFSRENLSKDLTNYTSEGAYAMYFKADQDGDYTFTWTYETNVITMTFPYKEATALDNTEAGETAVKVMQNGQLMIMKNGKTYNAQGQIIK